MLNKLRPIFYFCQTGKLLPESYFPKLNLKQFPISNFNHDSTLYIHDEMKLKKKIQKFQKDGKQNLDIICDFDHTITGKTYNNAPVDASFGKFQFSKFVSEEFRQKAVGLFQKYHQLEIDPQIDQGIKEQLMEEWWILTYEILVEEKINKQRYEQILNNANIAIRHGFDRFFKLCQQENIQYFILSGGITDIIYYVVKQLINIDQYQQLKLYSNKILYDNRGYIAAFSKQIVHSHNKEDVLYQHSNKLDAQLGKNALVFGDSIHDYYMTKGANYEEQISFGFQNRQKGEDLIKFKKKFDIVYEGDGSFQAAEFLLKIILQMPVDQETETLYSKTILNHLK